MTEPDESFDDIPGTLVFDGARLRQGYALNKFLSSLLEPANRSMFKADQAAYLTRFNLTPDQREAVLRRDWTLMLELGGNIFCMTKLAIIDGVPFQHVNAIMCGMSDEDYISMMNAGGRSMDGIRGTKGRADG